MQIFSFFSCFYYPFKPAKIRNLFFFRQNSCIIIFDNVI